MFIFLLAVNIVLPIGVEINKRLFQIYEPMDYYYKILKTRDQSYDSILRIFGEPKSVDNRFPNDEKFGGIMYYDDMEIFVRGNSSGSISITNPKIRFGYYRVGVGSTAWEVQKAYKGLKRLGGINKTDLIYEDNDSFVTFHVVNTGDGSMCSQYYNRSLLRRQGYDSANKHPLQSNTNKKSRRKFSVGIIM